MNHRLDLRARPTKGSREPRITARAPSVCFKHRTTDILIALDARIGAAVILMVGRVDQRDTDALTMGTRVRGIKRPDLGTRRAEAEVLDASALSLIALDDADDSALAYGLGEVGVVDINRQIPK